MSAPSHERWALMCGPTLQMRKTGLWAHGQEMGPAPADCSSDPSAPWFAALAAWEAKCHPEHEPECTPVLGKARSTAHLQPSRLSVLPLLQRPCRGPARGWTPSATEATLQEKSWHQGLGPSPPGSPPSFRKDGPAKLCSCCTWTSRGAYPHPLRRWPFPAAAPAWRLLPAQPPRPCLEAERALFTLLRF